MNKDPDRPMLDCTCRKPYLAIGLDFGTTYSSGSFARITNCNACRQSRIEGPWLLRKFPTSLVYSEDDAGSASNISLTIPSPKDETASKRALRYFKMRLPSQRLWKASTEEMEDLHRHLRENACVPGANTTAATMVSTFLTHLWEGVKSMVDKKYPNSRDKMKMVVTYPSCFEQDDDARPTFTQALAEAKFDPLDDLSTMTEHEAALRSTLLDSNKHVWASVFSAASIVVVDCGGMTIDGVLCLLPDTNNPDDKAIVQSVSRLGGGVWADTVIRKGVSERLQEWLGDGATDALVEIAAQPVMEYWRKKIQPIIFSGNEVEIDFSVPLATGMTYEISQEHIDVAYDKTISAILDVIKQLFTASRVEGFTPMGVILTGGMARNGRVVARVESALETDPDCKEGFLVVGEDPWHAVVRGATLVGLNPTALYRLSHPEASKSVKR